MNNQIKEEGLTDAYLLGKYDGIKQGRADAFDEFISTIMPRMKWGNDVYALAIEHCIEVAKLLKEQNGKS